MLVKKSRQHNLYRSPNLHSSVSGSNCQSVFPSAVVRLLQSRASWHQLRTTWQLRSRVQHGSTTQSHPRGQRLHFMERHGRVPSFLKAVGHEGVCLLMQIYLHYIGRWWYTNCQLILIKHHIFPLRVQSHTSCSAEEGTGGWRGEMAGERLSRGGHSSKTHPSFQRWPNITLLTVTMTHTLKEFPQSQHTLTLDKEWVVPDTGLNDRGVSTKFASPKGLDQDHYLKTADENIAITCRLSSKSAAQQCATSSSTPAFMAQHCKGNRHYYESP